MNEPRSNEPPSHVTVRIRHDLRNRLTAISNAANYVQKSLEKQGALSQDPRVLKFLELIGSEIKAAEALLDEQRAALLRL